MPERHTLNLIDGPRNVEVPKATCMTCGATGDPYFFGHDDAYAPHPYSGSTGSEGHCDLCGGPPRAPTHEAHEIPWWALRRQYRRWQRRHA